MSARILGTEVRFDVPWALALLALVVIAAALELRRERGRSGGVLFSSLGLLPRARGSWRVRLRWLLLPLRVAAASALIVALAAPSVVHAAFDVPAEGIDIVIVVDTSSSMTTPDLGGEPRIEVVKKVVHDFLGGLKNDRVGIVIFSAESMVLSPLTLDYAAAQRLVEPVAAGRPLRDGTAIGTGLATGLNVVRESAARGKVAILLTDGQNNAGDVQPTDAAQIAKLIGVRLYTIGAVAARSRAEVDEALMRSMSEMTGGLYFRASDETALRDVYREIQTLEKARVGTRVFISTDDASLPFAAAGAGLLALQLLLALSIFRRTP
ncbi:MAG TPA: VWA domain-containing protein [Candidatus Limnocylindria bacterium]|nr:VWA domain-containing protein [Candidatus Limnocylindria bacterium]